MEGFCPLASGSKGNCLYLGTKNTKILIDAGLSARMIKQRLSTLNVDLSEIQAILITHEHIDHIVGLKTLALQLGIPVFCNHDTAKAIYHILKQCPKFKLFTTGETFEFGDLEIHPFSIPHDTLDPVAFTIQYGLLKVGICTDLGFVPPIVEKALQRCHYLYLEANHQISMVHACSRPMIYKQRVLGRNGHLSNEACGQLLAKVAHSDLIHVYLAHLSSECNSHPVAMQVICDILKSYDLELDLSIAPQEECGKIIFFNEVPSAF